MYICFQYDFSLESKVIEWSDERRKALEAIRLAKLEEERLAAEVAKKIQDSTKETSGILFDGQCFFSVLIFWGVSARDLLCLQNTAG